MSFKEETIMSIIKTEHLVHNYIIKTSTMDINTIHVLKDIDFEVEKGEFVSIMGRSGCGKSTFLKLLGMIERPTSGTIYFDGMDTEDLWKDELADIRRRRIGFVFQDFNLLDNFCIQDNIFLPLVLSRTPYQQMASSLAPIAKKVEINESLQKYPYEVSGGQKQRTAVARALITNPRIVLADEPTGALDSKAATHLLRMFADINESGQTILMVTHSVNAASHAGRVLFIKDGEVFHQIYRGRMTNDQMYQKISDALTALSTGGAELE